jgi:hypothetical protein
MGKASSILFGRDAQAEPVRDALVWSQTPMIVRMSNGTRLTFPAPTTHERAALVASEYHQLLDVEAGEQRAPYLLHMLAIWLAPFLLLIAGLALSLFDWRIISQYVRQRTEKVPGHGDNRFNDSNTTGAVFFN